MALPPNSPDFITAGLQAGHAIAQTKRAAPRDGDSSPIKKAKHGNLPCNTAGCLMQQCATAAAARPPPPAKRASLFINKNNAGKLAAPVTNATVAVAAKVNVASSSCAPSTSAQLQKTSKSARPTSNPARSAAKSAPSGSNSVPSTITKTSSTNKVGQSARVLTEYGASITYTFVQKLMALAAFMQESEAAATSANLTFLQSMCTMNDVDLDNFLKFLDVVRAARSANEAQDGPFEPPTEQDGEDDEVDADGGDCGEGGGVSDDEQVGVSGVEVGDVAEDMMSEGDSAEGVLKMCDDAGV